jgi:NAD(P)-dependent dehydrogenase (short-subunit alcohol dehydrogenase family)
MGLDRDLFRVFDVVLDRAVLPGYSRAGYLARRHYWPPDPPPGALEGTTSVVTGASSGLGQATAAGLARLGSRVHLAVRDDAKGARARAELESSIPVAELHVARCDVSSLADVRRFANQLAAAGEHPGVLVHNAGLLPAARSQTPEGHEITLATHVLGPFLLTNLLAPHMPPGARVVFVSSGGMYTQPLAMNDPEYRSGTYRGATAYARTKRMQVTLAALLAEHHAPDDIGVHAMHPGWAETAGVADSLPAFHRIMRPALRSPAEGADTAIWLAATQPPPPSGTFWHDRRPRPAHYLPGCHDDPHQRQHLWDYCRETTRGENPE